MKSFVRIGGNRNGRGTESEGGPEREQCGSLKGMLKSDHPQIDARAELIQALIPIGLEAVNDLLQQEVVSLVGARYSRSDGEGDDKGGHARWGQQQGSVYLGDQKVAVTVPRVRDFRRKQEVPLASYQALRHSRRAEEAALWKAEPVP